MQLLRTDTTTAERQLFQRLFDELQSDKQVLWLLSGGSNIQAAVRIMEAIPDDISQKLSLALIDERYGPVGHTDSNWQQLEAAGLDAKQAEIIPCLQPEMSHAATAETYQTRLSAAFEDADIVIGLLGMGADGHIAGILPRSVATKPCQDLVMFYDGPDYKRITLTFTALEKITALYVFAFGASKRAALRRLQAGEASYDEQPAQFLKQHPESYLYNDEVGENI